MKVYSNRYVAVNLYPGQYERFMRRKGVDIPAEDQEPEPSERPDNILIEEVTVHGSDTAV